MHAIYSLENHGNSLDRSSTFPLESSSCDPCHCTHTSSVVIPVKRCCEPMTVPAHMREYTREEVAQHCSHEDQWIIIEDKVYDITNWVKRHPGGKVISYYRGTTKHTKQTLQQEKMQRSQSEPSIQTSLCCRSTCLHCVLEQSRKPPEVCQVSHRTSGNSEIGWKKKEHSSRTACFTSFTFFSCLYLKGLQSHSYGSGQTVLWLFG